MLFSGDCVKENFDLVGNIISDNIIANQIGKNNHGDTGTQCYTKIFLCFPVCLQTGLCPCNYLLKNVNYLTEIASKLGESGF